MIVRLLKNEHLSQMGSEVSKLTMNLIFLFGVFYLVINPISNLTNRKNIKNLCEKIEWIEEKVKKIFLSGGETLKNIKFMFLIKLIIYK